MDHFGTENLGAVVGEKGSSFYLTDIGAEDIKDMIPQVLQAAWENVTVPLSTWQKGELAGLEELGVSCLLNMWFVSQRDLPSGTYCNATWDNFYCWPPSVNGTVAERHCSDILTTQSFANQIQGIAVRVCQGNGTWKYGNWTNYTQCADSYNEYTRKSDEDTFLALAAHYILFVGSLISLICLGTALVIFCHFKCLWCNRITVHTNLMVALLLRCALIIVIAEQFIFDHKTHYRNLDIVCKAVLSVNLYATVASISWMFLQGLYLNGKLTTNVFDQAISLKIYYTVGWILPLLLVGIYIVTMEVYHPVHCWKDYSDRNEIWILLGPIILALLANLVFLINILRVLLTTVQRTIETSDAEQFRRAFKATIVLFPLLGMNNLLFVYNPGGAYNKFFVVLNALFGSTQGIFVSILYCFVSKDVQAAVYRKYTRYLIRRTSNLERKKQLLSKQPKTVPKNFFTRVHIHTVNGNGSQQNDVECLKKPREAEILHRPHSPQPPLRVCIQSRHSSSSSSDEVFPLPKSG